LTGTLERHEMGPMEQRRDGLLTLRNSFSGTSYCMRLSGELDLENVESFAAEITRMEDSGAEETVVDLSQLEFIDPCGMAALAKAERRFRADGRHLHLLGEPRRFARHGG
jgi:anti-anti-sigma factor